MLIIGEFFVGEVKISVDLVDTLKIEPYRDTFFFRRGYLTLIVNDREVYLHRFLLNPPRNMVVDHIDRDKTNNTRDNLRVCTRKQNSANVAPQKGRQYKGVRFYPQKNRYHAQARDENGKKKHLGYFLTQEEGARAYNDYVFNLRGEYAWLNDV